MIQEKGIISFLETNRPKKELKLALEVIREFKDYESRHEWLHIPFVAWTKLEQLEEFLKFLTGEGELKKDTLEQVKLNNIKLSNPINGDNKQPRI